MPKRIDKVTFGWTTGVWRSSKERWLTYLSVITASLIPCIYPNAIIMKIKLIKSRAEVIVALDVKTVCIHGDVSRSVESDESSSQRVASMKMSWAPYIGTMVVVLFLSSNGTVVAEERVDETLGKYFENYQGTFVLLDMAP